MALGIETFSSLNGGNSFFKAVTHPEVATDARRLVQRLSQARTVAIYDPQSFLEGFAACHDLGAVCVDEVYVQDVAQIGRRRLGREALPISQLGAGGADLIFVTAFDADRLAGQIAHLAPSGADLVSLDAMRLEPARLTNL